MVIQNGLADASADRLMRLHHALEDRGNKGDDWTYALALEDRTGANQQASGDFDRAEAALQRLGFYGPVHARSSIYGLLDGLMH